MKKYEVWMRSWILCVGTEEKPGCFSLHTEEVHVGYFVKMYRCSLPWDHNGIPDSAPFYSPRGEPSKIEVDEVTFHQIPKESFGAWFDQRQSQSGSPVWVVRQKP